MAAHDLETTSPRWHNACPGVTCTAVSATLLDGGDSWREGDWCPSHLSPQHRTQPPRAQERPLQPCSSRGTKIPDLRAAGDTCHLLGSQRLTGAAHRTGGFSFAKGAARLTHSKRPTLNFKFRKHILKLPDTKHRPPGPQPFLRGSPHLAGRLQTGALTRRRWSLHPSSGHIHALPT